MKTAANIIKSLALGTLLLTGVCFTYDASAEANLTTTHKNELDGVKGKKIGQKVADILKNTPAADKEDMAKKIVAYLGSKPGVGREELQEAVRQACALLPNSSVAICLAAANGVASGNPGMKVELVKAIAAGGSEGASAQKSNIITVLLPFVPTLTAGDFGNPVAGNLNNLNVSNPSKNVSNPSKNVSNPSKNVSNPSKK
ncbi:MAG: hypothetical protein EBS05_01340 [Proteobacteria bacterium]|nr:hypothetical protein [Pseudomonadota bacterium]